MQQVIYDNLLQFVERLNKAPESEWIQKHDGYDYIPVSIIETEMSVIFFGLTKTEILSERTQKDEQVLTVRLWAYHPVLNEWYFNDGIGASYLDYTLLNPLKSAGALAYSEAIKVAAKKFGKRFGSDLNRDNKGDYAGQSLNKSNDDMQPITSKVKIVEMSETIVQMIADAETTEQVVDIYDGNKNLHSNKDFVNLIMTRKTQLKNGRV